MIVNGRCELWNVKDLWETVCDSINWVVHEGCDTDL